MKKPLKITIHNQDKNGVNIDRYVPFINVIRVTFTTGVEEYNIISKRKLSNRWEFLLNNPWKAQSPVTEASKIVSFEPILDESFQLSEYNVKVYYDKTRGSKKGRKKVEYNQGVVHPSNLTQLLNDTAENSEVQEFYYTLEGTKRGRYEGSKLQASELNEWNPGDISYGKTPVVQSLGTVIFEFDYGGGTSPEILTAGGLNLTQLHIIGDGKDNVESISKNTGIFDNVLSQAIKPGDKIALRQYTSSAPIPGVLEVVANDLTVPVISTYMIPKNTAVGPVFSGNTVSINTAIPTVELNGSGLYTASTQTETPEEVSARLNLELSRGYRIFITFYTTLGNTVEYSGVNKIRNFVFKNPSNPQYPDELGQYGVREIKNVSYNSGTTTTTFTLNFPPPTIPASPSLGDDYGALIWISYDENIVVKQSSLSGVGAGGLYLEDSKEVIIENFTYITKKFGQNK